MKFVGWLLGVDHVSSIDDIDLALAAPWVQGNLVWLLLGLVALPLLAILFYRRFQVRASVRSRSVLGLMRGTLLALLLLTLAAPALRLTVTSVLPPTLLLVFDGTDSMAIEDQWTREQRIELARGVGDTSITSPAAKLREKSRADYVRALLLRNDQHNVLEQLREKGIRLEGFLFDGHSTSHLRRLSTDSSARELPGRSWAEQLTTNGQVTALGAILEDVRKQPGIANLAGVVLFSDFAHNAGTSPIGDGNHSPATLIGVPVHTVGLGAIEMLDLAIELQTDPKMKKAERTSIIAKLRQTGLAGQQATIKLVARRMSGDASGTGESETIIGETTIPLTSAIETTEFSFTPRESGLFEFAATVQPLIGESIQDNNRTSRQVNIIDDYLRLMYVAFEPDWEWRFVKEVFHRDKLVGMDGFRTFLGSSDPRVRERNVLFLETLTPRRAEFFANDVLFLGDMPESALTKRFGDMVKEFVGTLGGGLVVIAGPRFGPRELSNTPIAEMLPVVVDPNSRLLDERPFRLKRTAHAALYPFMRLGESATENEKAWNNLAELPWYQPVAALHQQAVVLAEHPTDKCADGKTPQPLIAVRQYGKGEVVYLGFNEVWRLRRRYGEQYYRQFWSQLIYRLGMSHALGDAKRFVPRIDRPLYRVEDKVTLSVEAYDENYEPLGDEDLSEGGLVAELLAPARNGAAATSTKMTVPLLRSGLFEIRFPVYTPGEYAIRLQDPVTKQFEERRFEVTDSSAERRRVVRDLRLQEEIAQQTGGKSYDLTNVARLPGDLQLEPLVQKNIRNHPLWSTPIWFTLIVGLMLGEWLARKWLYMH